MEKIGLNIGFDGDGVLIKSEDPVVSAINRLLEREGVRLQFTPEETGTWRHHYETILAKTNNEVLALAAERFWFNADTICDADAIDGAFELLDKLDQLGIESWMATSRDPKEFIFGKRKMSGMGYSLKGKLSYARNHWLFWMMTIEL